MKNKNKIYENYYSHHYNTINKNKQIERKRESQSLHKSIGKIINLNKNSKVLDIGCGFGRFTYYCQRLQVKNYTGVDISKEEIKICKEDFPEYEFIEKDIFSFLEKDQNKYDIIFMSHFLEHFKIEDGRIILEKLKTKLRDKGKIVNIMPNGHSYFQATAARYEDLTHELIYTPQSFTQLLKLINLSKHHHYNYYIGKNKIIHIIHKIALTIFEVGIRLLGYDKRKIYTSSMITIIENE